ncbi:MAG: hypothetical protein DMF68_11590 [Acidobacteria bacterium]|nr:MAG: hypothetical protein DMF68_11590 [Acidobacteriota bacterium]
MKVNELKVGVLTYFVGTEFVYASLIGSGRVQKFRLARWDHVFPLIDQLFEAMERGSLSATIAPPEFHSFSYEWGRELLPPPADLKPFDVLIIIPHHSLHGLPLHTIWLEEADQFLATSHAVAYCSSATLLKRCMDRNRARQHDLASWQFALGEGEEATGPERPRRCVAVGTDVIGDRTSSYHSLSDKFASYFEDALTECATRQFKIRLKGDRRWEAICIVCHGYLDPKTSDNSGLLLERDAVGVTIRPIPLHRGVYYDFRDLPFQYLPVQVKPSRDAELMTISELKVDCLTDAQIVALFGCSTGAGHLISGDDFSTMAYQWLKIGAASALANLWEADIDFILRWSPYFLHKWLIQRQPKAIAWREANRAVLGESPETSPYYWGVVSLFGDWL